MEMLLALLVGVFTASGCYLLLHGSYFRLLLGIVLLGQAANLLIFSVTGLGNDSDAIIPVGMSTPLPTAPDPLAQAMILTAIVIGFGILAFCLALVCRATEEGDAAAEGEVD